MMNNDPSVIVCHYYLFISVATVDYLVCFLSMQVPHRWKRRGNQMTIDDRRHRSSSLKFVDIPCIMYSSFVYLFFFVTTLQSSFFSSSFNQSNWQWYGYKVVKKMHMIPAGILSIPAEFLDSDRFRRIPAGISGGVESTDPHSKKTVCHIEREISQQMSVLSPLERKM